MVEKDFKEIKSNLKEIKSDLDKFREEFKLNCNAMGKELDVVIDNLKRINKELD